MGKQFPAETTTSFRGRTYRLLTNIQVLIETKLLVLQNGTLSLMHWKLQEIEFTLSTGDTWIVFFPPGMGWVRRFSFLLKTSGADKSQTNFLIGHRKISHVILQFSSVFQVGNTKKITALSFLSRKLL